MFHTLLQKWQPVLFLSGLTIMYVWESLSPFFSFDKRVGHGITNLIVSGLNVVVLALVFAVIMVKETGIVLSHGFGLVNWMHIPFPLNGIIAFIALDVWTYWWHRFNHVVPFFWRFHRMHHSDPKMDVTTATRFHIGEIIMSSCIRLVLIALIGIPLWTLIVYDVILLASTQFHHSNIYLPDRLDKAIRMFIVSPYMHKVHHSNLQPETDSNFTSIFSVWDRVFGSYKEREDYHAIQFGVQKFDEKEFQTIKGLLVTPFVKSKS